MTGVPPLPPVPGELRHRQLVLDASMWISVVGVLAVSGALWGPAELDTVLVVLVLITAAAAGLHALARPALLLWANPSRDLELPELTQSLLSGSAVSSIGVATGTVGEGGEESDDLRLRVGSRVLLSPVVADVDPRRLAALVLTAREADRGVTSPTVLWAGVGVIAALDDRWVGATGAAICAGGFIGLGVRHAWRGRGPGEAVLERLGAVAVMFSYLVLGWTTAARSAREDPEHADHLWQSWVTSVRDPEERTDGLTAEDVDAELEHLPRWDR